jgi:hypothetical protein
MTIDFSFCFATTVLNIMGHVIHHLKGVFETFPTVLQTPKFQKIQLVIPKKICSHLAIVKQAGQKNCNGKRTSALKESWAYAYYW